MSQDIGIVFEDFFDQIRLLSAQINDFPAPAALGTTAGANSGAAARFKQQLNYLSMNLEDVAVQLRADLEKTEQVMRDIAAEMAETDAAAADIARAVLVQLEAIPNATPATPASAPAAPAAAATPTKGTFQ